MKIKKIDKLPPSPSGDVKKDIAALSNYLVYLHEQINLALNTIEKKEETKNG